jgi:hypothetical protein
VLLAGCDAPPAPPAKTEAPAARPQFPAVKDQSIKFLKESLVSASTTQEPMLGIPALPGGNIAVYRRGKDQWKVMLMDAGSGTEAGVLVYEWKKSLEAAQFVASFGGYFGRTQDGPLFLFAKNNWLVGILGLEKDAADAEARKLAAKL